MKNKTLVEEIAREIAEFGGDAYYVGGYVRDYLLGRESKDIDVEIYNLSVTTFREILSNFGEVDEVGKSFGVLRIKGLDVDFSMPRIEYSTGRGHCDFDVDVNPFMSIETATRRRDFTINAILMNVLTEEIIDPFNGIKDLHDHIIRHVSAQTFVEDPLRVYRACQFAARFNFAIDHETIMLMREINTLGLPYERINEEMKKALLMGVRPSAFFEYLKFSCHEVPLLLHLPDDRQKFVSTMMRLNEAATVRDELPEKERFLFMYSALHEPGNTVPIRVGEQQFDKAVSKMDVLQRGVAAILHIFEEKTNDDRIDVEYLLYKQFSKFDNTLILYYLTWLYLDLEEKAMFYNIYHDYLDRLKKVPRLTGLDLINAGVPSGKKIGILLDYANSLWCCGWGYEEIKKEVLHMAEVTV